MPALGPVVIQVSLAVGPLTPMIASPCASNPIRLLDAPVRLNHGVVVLVLRSSLITVLVAPWGTAAVSVPYAKPAATPCQYPAAVI